MTLCFVENTEQIFYDPSPQVIQRKGHNSVSYTQNIILRYLQPPPVDKAGPLIIKEVKLEKHSSYINDSFD